MARRVIRTVDGQTFSDSTSRFEDRKGYVLYRKSPFNKIRINKKTITTDDITGFPSAVVMFGIVILAAVLMVVFLSFNRRGETDDIQNYVNPPPRTLPKVIASRRTGVYYLPECPGYKDVMPENRIGFETEQQALEAGFERSEKCP